MGMRSESLGAVNGSSIALGVLQTNLMGLSVVSERARERDINGRPDVYTPRNEDRYQIPGEQRV